MNNPNPFELTFRGLTPDLPVRYKMLDEASSTPQYGTDGAAAVDLCAIAPITIEVGQTVLMRCGIAIEVPRGFAGLVCSRSGLALKNQVFVLNGPGVIDSDYRGEIGAVLCNLGTKPFQVSIGDRVAQFMLVPVERMRLMQVTELSDTKRGEGGFGSTGGFKVGELSIIGASHGTGKTHFGKNMAEFRQATNGRYPTKL